MLKCEDIGCLWVIIIYGYMEWIFVWVRCSEYLEVEMCGFVVDCLVIVFLVEIFLKCVSLQDVYCVYYGIFVVRFELWDFF